MEYRVLPLSTAYVVASRENKPIPTSRHYRRIKKTILSCGRLFKRSLAYLQRIFSSVKRPNGSYRLLALRRRSGRTRLPSLFGGILPSSLSKARPSKKHALRPLRLTKLRSSSRSLAKTPFLGFGRPIDGIWTRQGLWRV